MKIFIFFLIMITCFSFIGCSSQEEDKKVDLQEIKDNRDGLDYKTTAQSQEDDLLMHIDALLQKWQQAQRKQDHAVAMHTEKELEEISRGHFSFLIKSLNSDKSSIAAMALGFSSDIRAIPSLEDSLQHGNLMTRCNAAMALGHIGSDNVTMDVLTKILAQEDEDEDVRAMVAFAIAQCTRHDKDFGSLSTLHKVLSDRSSLVKNNAIIALRKIGKKESGKNILATTINDEHPIVRYNSLLALLNVSDWDTAKIAIVKRMRDPMEDVAHTAFQVATILSGKKYGEDVAKWEEYVNMAKAEQEK